MKRTVLAAAVALVAALTWPATAGAQSAQKSGRSAPIAAAEEARDFVKALRSIEARTASGLNVGEYSREVGDLRLAASALDELLERRNQSALRQQVAQAVAPYQDAKDIWAICVQDCGFKIIAFGLQDGPAQVARQILSRYPALDATEPDGVLMDAQRPGRIFYPQLLSALWAIGQQRSRAARAALSQ